VPGHERKQQNWNDLHQAHIAQHDGRMRGQVEVPAHHRRQHLLAEIRERNR